jgi:hypothetical protein
MTRESLQRALEKVNDYEQSLNACLTFIHIYRWDDLGNKPDNSVLYWIGKEYGPDGVTPDITLQLTHDRGLVVELKESLPKRHPEGRDYWKGTFDQLKNYDACLEGWETESRRVGQQELVLIVDQKLVRRVIDYIKEKEFSFHDFSKNFCIVQYSPLNGLREGVFLRIEDGEIDDFKTVTARKLRDGIPVALDYLLSSGLSRIKFLDYEPPLVYTMSILWDHVFSALLSEEDWRRAKMGSSRKLIRKTVSKSELRDVLARNFTDENSKQGIEEKWVEEALESFVKLGLAEREEDSGKYTIKYRKKIPGGSPEADKQQIFAELLYKNGVQTTLEKLVD